MQRVIQNTIGPNVPNTTDVMKKRMAALLSIIMDCPDCDKKYIEFMKNSEQTDTYNRPDWNVHNRDNSDTNRNGGYNQNNNDTNRNGGHNQNNINTNGNGHHNNNQNYNNYDSYSETDSVVSDRTWDHPLDTYCTRSVDTGYSRDRDHNNPNYHVTTRSVDNSVPSSRYREAPAPVMPELPSVRHMNEKKSLMAQFIE
jgi:hypothetical protein